MATGFKNVGFMPEDYELLTRLRDKLKENSRHKVPHHLTGANQ
jgi:hypothetical protein